MNSETKLKEETIIIKGARVLTMDSGRSEYLDSCLHISNGKFTYVGSDAQAPKVFDANVIEASGKLIIPPFFNSHTHVPMSLFRGLGNDVSLKIWLEKFMWPAEAKYLNRETVYLGALLSGIEMIKSGANIFADMYFFEDDVAKAAIKLGMRAVLGEAILDFPTPNKKTPDEGLHENARLIGKYKDNPLIEFSIPAHAPYTCSTLNLQKVTNFGKQHNIPQTIHLSETKAEVEDSLKKHGKSPVKYLDEIGFFDHHTVCYHCVYLSDEDINILLAKDVSVVTLPNSNSKLASGIAPIVKLLDAGINIGLGTDGAASNNNTSMLKDLQTMVKIQKVNNCDPTVLSASEALKIATNNGAEAYGLSNRLGSIEVGKEADLLIIDTDTPNMQPLHNPYAQIVYAMHSKDIESMIIRGEFVMKNRKILNIDEEEIISKIRKFALDLNID